MAITIRRPSDQVWSIDELTQSGLFRATRRAADTLDDTERELLPLLERQAYEDFMRLAVTSRKNILVSGPTGSGKTTYTKALIREIPARRAADHDRGCQGARARSPSQSCAAVLLARTIKDSRASRPSSCSSAVCA